MNNKEQNIGMKGNCADEEINGNENEKAEPEKEAVKEMSSTSAEIGSPPKEKAKKRLKIFFKYNNFYLNRANLSPNVLDEVLAWIKRTELAQSSLSTSSYAFNRYCWTYLHGWKVKPHIVRDLSFSRERDDQGNWQTILKKQIDEFWYTYCLIPIADINPPEYISGFGRISFHCCIEDRALQFMEKIIPLLKDVTIRFIDIDEDTMQNDSITRMMELLAPKTSSLLAFSKNKLTDLSKFHKQFPEFIDGIQSIYFTVITETVLDLSLELKWLNTPRKDGKQKMLAIYTEIPLSHIMKMGLFIDCVKEEFLHSTEPAKFMIYIFNNLVHEEPIEVFENFKIENKTTGEILELKCVKDGEKYFLILHKNDDEIPTKIEDLEKQFERETETIIWIKDNWKDWQ